MSRSSPLTLGHRVSAKKYSEARTDVMRRKVIIIFCVVAVVAVPFWFFWLAPGYDIQRVDSRLHALQMPYRSVKTSYFMDGGSIGIEIIDRDGQTEQFAIPAHLGDTKRYARVFVGAMHDRKPGAVEMAEAEHTKRVLVYVLQAYPNRTAWDDFALMALRRHPLDFVRCLIHKWRGRYTQ